MDSKLFAVLLVIVIPVGLAAQQGVVMVAFAMILMASFVAAFFGAHLLMETWSQQALDNITIGSTFVVIAAFSALSALPLMDMFMRFGELFVVPLGLGVGLLAGLWISPLHLTLTRRGYFAG